jgi:hypothetical protein
MSVRFGLDGGAMGSAFFFFFYSSFEDNLRPRRSKNAPVILVLTTVDTHKKRIGVLSSMLVNLAYQ